MDINTRDVVTAILTRATRELCALWDVSVEGLTTPASELDTVAVVGFTGTLVRGSLGLGVGPGFLAQVRPGATDEMALDWLGEAGNQLLGRAKNQLFAYGVSVAVAAPMVLRGLSIQVRQGASSGLITVAFETRGGPLTVWFDVQPELAFKLRAPEVEVAEPCAVEGEMVMF